MDDALLNLIEREQRKLERRRENVAATEAEIEVLGDSVKLRGKLQRQKAAVEESLANLEKLNKAGSRKK